MNAPALAYLATDGRFPALTRLALRANTVDPVGLRALLLAKFISHLTHLDLAVNQLGDLGAQALAGADLGPLRWLSVERNGIGSTGFATLAGSARLRRVATLRAAANSGGDWRPLVRHAFAGDEAWGDEFIPEGEIPF